MLRVFLSVWINRLSLLIDVTDFKKLSFLIVATDYSMNTDFVFFLALKSLLALDKLCNIYEFYKHIIFGVFFF